DLLKAVGCSQGFGRPIVRQQQVETVDPALAAELQRRAKGFLGKLVRAILRDTNPEKLGVPREFLTISELHMVAWPTPDRRSQPAIRPGPPFPGPRSWAARLAACASAPGTRPSRPAQTSVHRKKW